MIDQKIQLQVLQQYIQSFQNWLQEAVLNPNNLYAILIAIGIGGLVYILLLLFHEPVTRRLQKYLLRTRLKFIAPRIHELLFLMGFVLALWCTDFGLKITLIDYSFLQVIRDLTMAYLLMRIASFLVKRSFSVAVIIIFVGAFAILEILGILSQTMRILNEIGINIAGVDISLYLLLTTLVIVVFADLILTTIKDSIISRINSSKLINPSQKVLIHKGLNITIIVILLLVALGSLGFSFTTLAVFTGALGLGLGLGLQKIILNVLSGFLILMDRSIKPGDVIAINDTYGWVNSLKSRYISVITRDGIEHLIPNEKFISDPVENWTYSSSMLRVHIPIGVSYASDIDLVKDLMIGATQDFERILGAPQPVCLLTSFGDSSINVELRFWISDPENGMANIKSEVMEKIWKNFQKNEITIPFPQRDLHFYPIQTSQKGAVEDPIGHQDL